LSLYTLPLQHPESLHTPRVLLPYGLILPPPAAHEVASHPDVRSARVARHKMSPTNVEQPGFVPMHSLHLAEALAHVEVADLCP